MEQALRTRALSHRECVKLIRSPERYRHALVSIDGQDPVSVMCFVLDDGDLLVPAGEDPYLIRRSASRTVAVTVTHRNLHAPGGWTVTGVGLARPLVSADRPVPFPHQTSSEFRAGIRVVMARLTGQLTSVTEDG